MDEDTSVEASDSHTMLDGGGSYGTVSTNPAKQLMLAGLRFMMLSVGVEFFISIAIMPTARDSSSTTEPWNALQRPEQPLC